MIEAVSPDNIEEILPMIRQYQEFYKVADICDSRNRAFFSQFGDSSPAGCQFLYRDNGVVLGFATVYFSHNSTLPAKVGILNDLYCVEASRGKGVGRLLVEHCYTYVMRQGAARLQWVTAPDNEPANKLYQSMNTAKSNWFFYAYNGPSIAE
ncbi:MAG: GNAT family N-acetyltransferase [Pseudomonadales bacterium]|nr:GNAT family N-acetyltransferase [Pseudomonadales bacterium]